MSIFQVHKAELKTKSTTTTKKKKKKKNNNQKQQQLQQQTKSPACYQLYVD